MSITVQLDLPEEVIRETRAFGLLETKRMPDFAGSDRHHVRLTLRGEAQNPQFIKSLENIGAERLVGFTTQDFLVFDQIQHEKPACPALPSQLPQLIVLGVIESVGRGRGVRHFPSQVLYAHLNQKGAYTRKRGLDRETNKELLLKQIADTSPAGANLEELQQVLPALSRQQIAGLLRELRDARNIHTVGSRKAARWFPGWPAPNIHKHS